MGGQNNKGGVGCGSLYCTGCASASMEQTKGLEADIQQPTSLHAQVLSSRPRGQA